MDTVKVLAAAGLVAAISKALQRLSRNHDNSLKPQRHFSRVLAHNDDIPFRHHPPDGECRCNTLMARTPRQVDLAAGPDHHNLDLAASHAAQQRMESKAPSHGATHSDESDEVGMNDTPTAGLATESSTAVKGELLSANGQDGRKATVAADRKRDAVEGQDAGGGDGIITSEAGGKVLDAHRTGMRESSSAAEQHDAHPYACLIEQQLMSQPIHEYIKFEEPVMPPAPDDSPLHFVTHKQQLQLLVEKLSKVSRIAVDVEHNSTHSYLGMTCLMQLSAEGEDYIVDALKLHDHLHLLHPVYADPNIMKVFHGAGNDIQWLQRDFHLYIVNMFDTEKASRVLKKEHHNLGALLKKYCKIVPDKSQQTADWRRRPLPPELVRYARSDVHYLLCLADCLWKELLEASSLQEGESLYELGDNCPAAVTLKKSQEVCLALYHKPSHKAAATAAATHIYRRYLLKQAANAGAPGDKPHSKSAARALTTNKTNSESVRDCIYALCSWRDMRARQEDEGVHMVLPDTALVDLAESPPQTPAQLLKVVERHVRALNEVVMATPLAARYHISTAVKQDAKSLCAQLASAAAGEQPWLGFVDSPAHREHKSQQQLKQQRLQIVIKKFSAKSEVYDNCRMLSMDGELLCFCDKSKLRWYLAKGLAEQVSEDPLTIRLLFQHKNTDQVAGISLFYQHSKANRCVGCGEESNYRRYRVVPSCYRRHFPPQMKSHRSHDVVLVCTFCHNLANKAAEHLKREIAAEYGIPLFPPRAFLSVLPERDLSVAESNGQNLDADTSARHDEGKHHSMEQNGHSSSISGSVEPAGLSTTEPSTPALPSTVMSPNGDNTEQEEVDISVEGEHDTGPKLGSASSAIATAAGYGLDKGGLADSCTEGKWQAAGVSNSVEAVALGKGREDGACTNAGDCHDADVAGSEESTHLVGLTAGTPGAATVESQAMQAHGFKEDGLCEEQRAGVAGGSDTGESTPVQESGSKKGVALFKVRQAALALQRGGEAIPVLRRRALEGLIMRYVGRTPDDNGLLPGELERALLAGLSERKRRQFWRQQNKQMGANELHEEQEGASASSLPPSAAQSASPQPGFTAGGDEEHEQGGHMRHGKQLVELLLNSGEEHALMNLVQRFRKSFVDAVQPRFLPPSWDVAHNAMRDFGDYSIYRAVGAAEDSKNAAENMQGSFLAAA